MSPGSPGMSSSSARIGVMPTPPAMSATRGAAGAARGERAERALGDHARARAAARAGRRVKSPSVLDRDAQPPAVGRGRERERMRLPPAVAREEAPGKNWPARAPRRSSATPPISSETTPGATSGTTRSTRSRWRRPRASGTPSREPTSAASVADVERATSRRGRPALPDEVRAGGELVAERQRDREVGVEVHEVPRLVAQPAADDRDRADDDADQQHEPGGRREHARDSRERRPPRATARCRRPPRSRP